MFWAYLWGIETRVTHQIQRRKRQSFEPTYEELKRKHWRKNNSFWHRFWAYLWGIETLYSLLYWLSLLLVLSLPMRNWNIDYPIEVTNKGASFEPTYKELKLSPNSPICSRTGSFEPTYEELKLAQRWHISMATAKFWAYLWGIETRNEKNERWTRTCFEPTYEELKQARGIICELDEPCFEPTYEELKPALYTDPVYLEATFWAYLWGIETGVVAIDLDNWWRFWAYLWGIETF